MIGVMSSLVEKQKLILILGLHPSNDVKGFYVKLLFILTFLSSSYSYAIEVGDSSKEITGKICP